MKKTQFLKWGPALFIITCSWILSSKEQLENMPKFFGADKIIHCICFACLAFWIHFALKKHKEFPSKKSTYFSILITSVYGVIDEIHQSFTPGRFSSFFDWIFDFIGAVIGTFIFTLFCYFLIRLNKKS